MIIKCLSVKRLAAGLLSGLLALAAQANEVVTLSTTVQGNQEHPSVTYIVPWRKAADEKQLVMPFKHRVASIVFDHVERAEHEREVQYLVKMQKDGAELQ
jgi:hypothetical protein